MLPIPIIPEALSSPRINPGPKEIRYSGSDLEDGSPPSSIYIHPDILNIAKNDGPKFVEIQKDLVRLIGQIKGKGAVDERYYKKSKNVFDSLLIGPYRSMHLHLLNQGSNVILYLIQTEKSVILLELGTHSHLDSTPVGKSFNIMHIRRAGARLRDALKLEQSS